MNMSWLLLILSAVFVATAAGENETLSAPQSPKDLNTGVVEIHNRRREFLCTGILLENWSALTIGDCVAAYRKHPFSLFVRVHNPHSHRGHLSSNLLVFRVLMNPKHRDGKPEHNLAIVYFFPNPFKHYHKFVVKKHHFSTKELIEKDYPRFVTHIEEHPLRFEAVVSEDYALCDENEEIENRYCVASTKKPLKYKKRDYGNPFYIIDNKAMTAVALYMGHKKDDTVEGHLFVSLFPSSKWIHDHRLFKPRYP